MSSSHIFLVLLSACVLALTACNASAPASPELYKNLAGTYRKALTFDDLGAAGLSGASARTVLKGTWEMELTADGRITLWIINETIRYAATEGTFTLTTEAFALGKDTGTWSCSNTGVDQATYRWKIEGDKLTLTEVKDECDRKFVMTTKSWNKVASK